MGAVWSGSEEASGRLGSLAVRAGAGDGREILSRAVAAGGGWRERSRRSSRPRMLFATRRRTDRRRSGLGSADAEREDDAPGDRSRAGVRVGDRSRELGVSGGWCLRRYRRSTSALLRPLVGTPFAAAIARCCVAVYCWSSRRVKAEGVGECDMLELLSGTGLLCNLQLWLYRQLRISLLLRIATSNAGGIGRRISGYVIMCCYYYACVLGTGMLTSAYIVECIQGMSKCMHS